MKKSILLITLSTICCGALMAQDSSDYKHEVFIHGQDTLPYRILWPENFNKNQSYPVVLFLHGAGERGNDNEKQLVHGNKLFLENRNAFPSIVVFPQCPRNDYWSNVNVSKNEDGQRQFNFEDGGQPTSSMQAVIALLDSVVDLNYTDKDRIYVGGLSMGGMGTFELVSRKPETFAAAFAICGGGDPESAGKYAGKVPFWIFHGEKDDIVPPINSKVMADAIEGAGGEVKLTLYPDANHNSWDRAFAEPQLLPWLFSKRN